MRPPIRRLAPQGQNHQAAPPQTSGGGVRGPGDPPFSPPPPKPIGGRTSAGETEALHPPERAAAPGGGHHSRGKRSRAPSAPGRPPAHSRITRCRPATERRHPGMRKQSGPLWCQPGEGGGADRGEGTTSPPPATLTNRRPAGPRLAPGKPDSKCIPQGGAPERDGGHGPPQGAGGRGAAARPPLPPPSPPPPPPACGPPGRRPSTPPGPRVIG